MMKVCPRNKLDSVILAVAFSAGLSVATQASGQVQYLIDLNRKTATPLEDPGDGFINTVGINDSGQIVGFAGHAFIAGPDVPGMRDLGTLGGIYSSASGINNAGQVVGYSETADSFSHAFITGPDGIGMRDLGTLRGYSVATDINDSGQVAGYSQTDPENSVNDHAFITGPDGVGMRDLGTLGRTYSSASGINNAGQVVGSSWTFTFDNHAFITGPNGVDMRDLGTLEGTPEGGHSDAFGVNDAGQAVGWSSTAKNEFHAFITEPYGGDMRDLGTLGGDWSYGWAINDAGEVVGSSGSDITTPVPGDWTGGGRAFVTRPDGGEMVDLNTLVDLPDGFILIQAKAINNSRQIIAVGIPEPESYVMFLAGLGLIGVLARRKRAPV